MNDFTPEKNNTPEPSDLPSAAATPAAQQVAQSGAENSSVASEKPAQPSQPSKATGSGWSRMVSVVYCFAMLLACLLLAGVGIGLLLSEKQPHIPPIFGHAHLLLVHFPLAFLVVASLLAFAAIIKKSLRPLVSVMVFIGGFSGVLALLSGVVAAIAYGYDFGRVWLHLVLASCSVCFAWLWWLLLRLRNGGSGTLGFAVLSLLLVSATGFSGGSFSHGDLLEYFSSKQPDMMAVSDNSVVKNAPQQEKIAGRKNHHEDDEQEREDDEHEKREHHADRKHGATTPAAVLAPAGVAGVPAAASADKAALQQQAAALWKQVEPLMQQACVDCHNAKRSKAGVDVSSREAIVQSVDPALLDVEKPQQSLLVTIIESGEMPPRSYADKTPNKQQIELIKKWLRAESALQQTK